MQKLADDEDDDAGSSSSEEPAPAKTEGKAQTPSAPYLKKTVPRPKLQDAPKKDILAEIRERAKMYKTATKAKADAGRNQLKVNKQSKYINKAAEMSESSSSSSSSSESESEDETPEQANVIKNTKKTRALKTLGTETKSVNTNSIKSRFEKKDNTDSSDDGMSGSERVRARSAPTSKTTPTPSPTPSKSVTTKSAEDFTPSAPKAESKPTTPAAPAEVVSSAPAPKPALKSTTVKPTPTTTTAAPAEEVPASTTPTTPVVRKMYGKYAMKPVVPEVKPIHVRKFKKPLSFSSSPVAPSKEEKPVAETVQLKHVEVKRDSTSMGTGSTTTTEEDESSSHDVEVAKTVAESNTPESAPTTIPLPPPCDDETPTSTRSYTPRSFGKSPTTGGFRTTPLKKEESKSESSFDLLDSDSSDDEDSDDGKKEATKPTATNVLETGKTAAATTDATANKEAKPEAEKESTVPAVAEKEETVPAVDVKSSPKTRDLKTLSTETKTVNTNSIKSKFEMASSNPIPTPLKPAVTPKFQVKRPVVEAKSPLPTVKTTPNFTLKTVKRPQVVDDEDTPDDEKPSVQKTADEIISQQVAKVDEHANVEIDNLANQPVASSADSKEEEESCRASGEKLADSAKDDKSPAKPLSASPSVIVNANANNVMQCEKPQASPVHDENIVKPVDSDKKPTSSENLQKCFDSSEQKGILAVAPIAIKMANNDEDEPFDMKPSVDEDEPFDLKHSVEANEAFDVKNPVEDKHPVDEDTPFDTTTAAEIDEPSDTKQPLDGDEFFDAQPDLQEYVPVEANKPSDDEEEPFDAINPSKEEKHPPKPVNEESSTDTDNCALQTAEIDGYLAKKTAAEVEVGHFIVTKAFETAQTKKGTTTIPEDEDEPFDSMKPNEENEVVVESKLQTGEPNLQDETDDEFDLKMTETETETETESCNLTTTLNGAEASRSETEAAAVKTNVDNENGESAKECEDDLSPKIETFSNDKSVPKDASVASDVLVYDIALNDSKEESKPATFSDNFGKNTPPVVFSIPVNAFDSENPMEDMEDESDASSYSDYTESSEPGQSSGEGIEPTQENEDSNVATTGLEIQLDAPILQQATQTRSSLPTINEGDSQHQGRPNKSIGAYLETDKRKKRHRRRRMGGGSNDSTISVESNTLQMAREFLRKNLAKNNTLSEISIEDLLKELEESEKRQKKLEKQLQQAGVKVAEDIPYEEALQQIERIAKRMRAIGGSDVTHEDKEIQKQLREEYYKLEQEMDRYNNALTMTDEYMKEQEAREKKWEDDNEAANLDALIKLRRHMPVNVRHLSEAVLTEEPTPNGKFLPKPMAKKFKRTNVLQLLRLNPEDIFRMHPSTLENLRVVGLTLTERRALYLHLKDVGPKWKAMQADKITNRKWVWYQMMKLNFTENLEQYERHCREYGPPGNHPYVTRENPHVGCPLIGKQCPLKADKIISYDGDYGFPPEAEYEVVGVAKADVDDPGAKAMQEALELAKEKKANDRSDLLKKHYNGKLLQVSKANGSCELMDEAMDKMEGHLMKWLEDVITGAHSTVEEYKKEVQSFTEVLGDLKLAVLQFAERSGLQVSGKKDASNDKKDIRSPVELGLCEEVFEVMDEFFMFIEQRMEEIKVHDGKVLSTIIQLRKLVKELHERNLDTLRENKLTRPARSRKLKTRKEFEKEIKKNQKPEEEKVAAPTDSQPTGGPLPGPPAGGRGDLMAALAGRGGRGGGRGDLMSSIAARGSGRGRGAGGGGRGDLLSSIAGRGGGGGRGDLLAGIAGRGGGPMGGRGDLMSAIAARGSGRGGGGRGDFLGAIAARGRGGE
jgi:hypothetical protein